MREKNKNRIIDAMEHGLKLRWEKGISAKMCEDGLIKVTVEASGLYRSLLMGPKRFWEFVKTLEALGRRMNKLDLRYIAERH